MNGRSPVSICGFGGCTSLGHSLDASLAAMGGSLSNFSDTGIRNLFGTRAMAAALLDVELPRIERLPVLAGHALADLAPLMAGLGLSGAPLLLGLPPGLSADETAALREVLHGSLLLQPEGLWFPYGRASVFAALAQATELISRGSHPFVIVGGIDSLCDPDSVSNLVNASRVLGPRNEGTIPGEAAIFGLLSRANRDGPAWGSALTIEGISVARAEKPFTELDRVNADGLAVTFNRFRERGAQRVDVVVAAHSGEGYFGRSFAHAYLRAVEVMPEPLQVEVIADRVGDVGAAAGMLGIAFAAHRFSVDPPGPGNRALVYSESDTGEIGAAIVAGHRDGPTAVAA
jgi:3-oxoacyl-[acyl-carrier-protein] synthase-1